MDAAPPAAQHQKHTRVVSSRVREGPLQVQSRDSSPSPTSSATPSRSSSVRRSSFGSVKEDVEGIAQTFVDTHPPPTSADHTLSVMAVAETQTPDFCCPCGAFLGWKQIRLGGRRLSRSYSDLRLLGRSASRGWAWDGSGERLLLKEAGEKKQQPAKRRVSIETLPVEVLVQIISYLAIDLPPNGYTPRNVDLISCLLTSRTLHSATLSVLYRNITIPHSVIFAKFLRHLNNYPALGTIVRRLDFSHFTSVGLGRTRQMNVEIQNLTSKTLLQCLDLLPNLMECLLQEHVEDDINAAIIEKIFTGLPNLRAVDFCGCSSQGFSSSFLEALTRGPELPSTLPQLRRVSLHECTGLSPEVFEILLPRLINVTHLDVTHTQITEKALFSIPETARITHLNLSRCSRLSGAQVVKFLTTHPAVSESLVYLNLMTDASRYRLLEVQDVSALLPKLPSSLRSLNLGGARIVSEHVPALIPLTKHLEELGLSTADLSINDLNSFFVPPRQEADAQGQQTWTPPALHYLDLTRVPSISLTTLLNPKSCVLVSSQSVPLEVLELSDKLITPLRERAKPGKSNGWTIRELGRRGWYVREPGADVPPRRDDGSRWWKMGARWWGMRKIPVAVGDVGGIYGHYMFKR
ncbi:hypothetical protein VTN77DRAFT_6750 [Rasamsonia byssochlamydoides]|uniref:uncharacterized protein n=1 Tax=Rasamsonia byssochlamydoides TaxID=89139 RepID=UPI0037422568